MNKASPVDYRLLFEAAAEAVLVVRDGHVLDVNAAAGRLFGRDRSGLVGQPLAELLGEAPAASASSVGRFSAEVSRADGTVAQVEVSRGEAVEAGPVLYTFLNVSGQAQLAQRLRRTNEELSASNSRLQEAARIDFLTELPNRRSLFERLQGECARAIRYRSPFVLMLLDVDNLKLVNDSFGHVVGDSLLRAVADRLRTQCRTTDLVARIGGDEFALLLPETEEAVARDLAERIVHALEDEPLVHDEVSGLDIWTGSSIGYACAGPAAAHADELLITADRAMYADKRRRHAARDG